MPAVAWRAQHNDLMHSAKEPLELFEKRFFIRCMSSIGWIEPNGEIALNIHRAYVLYYANDMKDYLKSSTNHHAAFNAFSISPLDYSYTKDVAFKMNITSSKHAAFAYKFNKFQTNDGFCCIASIDLPDGAVQQMRECIERRKADEKLYMPYIDILSPEETLEEVLVKRDLAGV